MLTTLPALPNAALLLTFKAPSLTLTPPENVLVPVRNRVPAPALVRPVVPAMAAPMVAETPVSVVIVGAAPVNVSGLLPVSE